ncbi:MAG: glucosaminidase domain-containing protein, partial [Oscillospiraceae bacterium]|nr:glucosaminidase domain-containing protein [Oscillospiraceae bacterium]
LFGIKAGEAWSGKRLSLKTWEVYDGKRVDMVDAFRAYDSWEESVRDHSIFLGSLPRYQNIVGKTDAEEVCRLLQKDGYATAPNYADSLIRLIRQYDLTSYDNITGWKLKDGIWSYRRDGVPLKDQWLYDEGYWYRLDHQGRMLTGLQQIDGRLYMLNPKRGYDIPTGACIITDGKGAVVK